MPKDPRIPIALPTPWDLVILDVQAKEVEADPKTPRFFSEDNHDPRPRISPNMEFIPSPQ